MTIADTLRLEGINAKGFGIIPKFVMTDTDLTPDAMAIYAYMCAHAGNGTTCFPSRGRLTHDLGIAKNTYYAHLKLLTDNGYVKIVRGKFASNQFVLVSSPDKLRQVKAPMPTGPAPLLVYGGLKAHGFGMIPRLVMTDNRLDRKAKALYAYFCAFTGAGSVSFPKIESIMYHLSLGKDTYYKYLQQLITFNYIHIMPRKQSGKFAGNNYIITEFPDLAAGAELAQLRRKPYLTRLQNGLQRVFAPHPKNCDTGKKTRKKHAFFAASPYPNFCDTSFCDTENCDTNRNSYTINSLISISQSELTKTKDQIKSKMGCTGEEYQNAPLRELAFDVLAAVELVEDDMPIRVNKRTVLLAANVKARLAALSGDRLNAIVSRVEGMGEAVQTPAAYLLGALYAGADTLKAARGKKAPKSYGEYDGYHSFGMDEIFACIL